MIITPRVIFLATVLAASILGACQTTTINTASPAMLKSGDAESIAALKSVLAKAMNKSTVKLGASDPTNSSTVSVLPPNNGMLGHNTTLPTHFDIMMKGDECYAVRRDTGEEFMLEGVSCTPA